MDSIPNCQHPDRSAVGYWVAKGIKAFVVWLIPTVAIPLLWSFTLDEPLRDTVRLGILFGCCAGIIAAFVFVVWDLSFRRVLKGLWNFIETWGA